MGTFIVQSCFDEVNQEVQIASDNSGIIAPIPQPGGGNSVNAPTTNNFGDVTTNQSNTNYINQFGTFENKKYRVVVVDVAADGSQVIDISGTVLVFHDAHDDDGNPVPSAMIKCSLESATADEFTIRPGWTMTGNKVKKIFLKWKGHGSPVLCEFMILTDNPMDRTDLLV